MLCGRRDIMVVPFFIYLGGCDVDVWKLWESSMQPCLGETVQLCDCVTVSRGCFCLFVCFFFFCRYVVVLTPFKKLWRIFADSFWIHKFKKSTEMKQKDT